MEIGREEVQRIAALARLSLSEAETEAFSRQLSSILSYVEQINRLDTTDVEPTATVLGQTNSFRPDKSRASLPLDRVLQNAPDSEDGHFRVPRIIEERRS
jgi:aspartyl-tRNA(Asn)/glutamyl-tRNA(Gln) amidotransferase subunit C